ncbi:MAG: bifunctional demethylmenaquinone methyltransferase/2-methoxy-6-polyprenyl-1,4-benzoquinol methylase UbiE [candidate division Zixibacteria bacterium]|nr:bifunctional demethylmenaquinone methyltransferase/2-methoxy-6-polyprenyl-1,4-benzoquinol methylase UbiE [candidate division Zixibacteria bacterium]
MFDRIAPRYDLLNRLLSGRRDVVWRRRLAAVLPTKPNLDILDLATGTGDVILTILNRRDNISHVVGLDPAGEMLSLAQKKICDAGQDNRTSLVRGDALFLPFPDGCFDAVTIAFGIRNVPDVPKALSEMQRVLKPGGKAVILEFSLPPNWLVRNIYLVYFRHILPRLGGIISGDAGAYRYLDATVETFPFGEEFRLLMRTAGFNQTVAMPLTFGVATLYTGMRDN